MCVPTGGLEIRPNKEWTCSWEVYYQGKDYNLVLFFPQRRCVIAVTVRRQGGERRVAGHGAELTRLSILGPRLIRKLHEEEYPSGLTKIKLSMLDPASFYDPSTFIKWLFIFFHAVSLLQAALICHCHGSSLPVQLVVELRTWLEFLIYGLTHSLNSNSKWWVGVDLYGHWGRSMLELK